MQHQHETCSEEIKQINTVTKMMFENWNTRTHAYITRETENKAHNVSLGVLYFWM